MNFKKRKKQAKFSTISIVFYVFAIIFLLYGAYMIFAVYDYLTLSYEANSISMSSQLASVIQYFMTNCSAYFVYAILCYGLGVIMQMVYDLKYQQPIEAEEVESFDEGIEKVSEVSSAV